MQNLGLRIARYGNIIFNKNQTLASGSHTKYTAPKLERTDLYQFC